MKLKDYCGTEKTSRNLRHRELSGDLWTCHHEMIVDDDRPSLSGSTNC